MSDLSNDSDFWDSDESDDNLELQLQEPISRNKNYLEEIVPTYSDALFIEHFRVSRRVSIDLSRRFQQSDMYKRHSGQYGKLCAESQVLIFLWYIGHQTSSFRDVTDRFDIAIASLHRIIQRVAVFISNLSQQVIVWPTDREKIQIERDFRTNGFPGVIGVIDGCHIKIDKPSIDPDSYINRKSYYSVQMQVVCDSNRKIVDVFIGYPGSVHDSRVFRNSILAQNLEEKCGRYYLLDDSGYPLKKNLMTPFKDRGELTRRQIRYNVMLSKNRYVIDTFGIIKQKFRQLYHLKLRSMAYIVHLIRAACVLHNIALDDNFQFDDEIEGLGIEPHQQNQQLDENEVDDVNAVNIRNNIVNNLIN